LKTANEFTAGRRFAPSLRLRGDRSLSAQADIRPQAIKRRIYSLAIFFGLCSALLCLAAPAPALDREAAYRSALSLYRDDSRQPLAVKVQSTTPFGGGRLMRFSYASTHSLRVPALLFIPPGASKAHPAPCLIALHGLGGNKELMAYFAQYALRLGYATLAIDEYGQGERPRAEAPGGPDVAALAAGIRQTVVDVRRGLDYLDARPDINRSRIGLVGVSLGAMIGTVSAGVDSRIKAAVLISGGGDWGLILQSLADRDAFIGGRRMGDLRGTNWDLVRAVLAPEDPLTFAPHIAPRALLMECSGRDMVIIPAAARLLYDAARRPANAHVQIDWFPDAGHVPPPELTYPKIRQWLAKNL